MAWLRPKSLTSLMLLALALAVIPLAVAVVDASFQMRQLATTSQQLVKRGVEATQSSQTLLGAIAALERNARLYSVLGNPQLLESYSQNDTRVSETRARLGEQLDSPDSQTQLAEIERLQAALATGLRTTQTGTNEFENLLAEFGQMSGAAARLATLGNQQLERELAELRTQVANAQRRLFLQTALLLPLTLAMIVLVTVWIGRPLRRIDRAISELGSGTLSHPISVSGPTDLQQLGRQLEWLRTRLLDLAEERNRFLRHMSHELKTPLANIREGTELLMDGAVGELATPQREVTAILRDNGIKLQRLIENLLSFSAWQTESIGLELTDFRARPLIKQVIENQQLTFLSQRLRLDVKAEDLSLRADRGKLRLILENLLSNAIKYSPRGGTIYLDARANGSQFELNVADCGPGIPRDDRAKIFDAFYTSKPASGHVKGTGIGLSVVMEFVTVHGGSIDLVDGQYPGAHFRVRLPLRSEQPKQLEQARAA